jgi:hypothetical protein
VGHHRHRIRGTRTAQHLGGDLGDGRPGVEQHDIALVHQLGGHVTDSIETVAKLLGIGLATR